MANLRNLIAKKFQNRGFYQIEISELGMKAKEITTQFLLNKIN